MKTFIYGIGVLLFLMALAISYYIIFGVIIIIAAFIIGKIAHIGHDEYLKAQRE